LAHGFRGFSPLWQEGDGSRAAHLLVDKKQRENAYAPGLFPSPCFVPYGFPAMGWRCWPSDHVFYPELILSGKALSDINRGVLY
jgi:hypothetical protein